MSNTTEEGLRTPRRYQIDEKSGYIAFTPCTRLSRMTIDSQSVGLNRTRSSQQLQQLPVTNLNQRLAAVSREQEELNAHHPNLDMRLSSEGISIYDKSKDIMSFSEDEDSDEGDLFSSNLCPMSTSPERSFTRESFFDDEIMLQAIPLPKITNGSLFDEDDDDDDDDEMLEQEDESDVFDPSNAWLLSIFYDNSCSHSNHHQDQEQVDEETDKENRPPRTWRESQTISLNGAPLSEIKETDDMPTRKKAAINQHGKTRKIRLMRSLSPPRFPTKQKDIQG